MPEGAGEYVDIPALLKGILNAYPGNSAILREYLQNSDDAQASSQVFVLDERTFSSETILDLKDRQGPSLLAINDGILEEADWKALQSIHSSSKVLDDGRTGKNGLGFRASYHLTENPHLLSGGKLVVLDAHREFSKHPGGIAIDTITEGAKYGDQLAPFLSIVEDFNSPYPGTVFRLPLRTKQQAQTSRITNMALSASDILELLNDFCFNELEEVILFLKHVTSIEVRHIKPNGSSSVIGRVDIEKRSRDTGTVCRRVKVKKPDGSESSRLWYHHYFSVDKLEAAKTLADRLGYPVEEKMHAEKLVPTVELALPCDAPLASGNLFTLLPLPIRTGFPLHLNAIFALTPDRQNLKNMLEIGGKASREKLLVEWNKTIFESWVPAAWANLLSDLRLLCGRFGPPEHRGKDTYWADIPNQIAAQVVDSGFAVFPTIRKDDDAPFFTSLQDSSVLLAGPESDIDLNLLADLNLSIIQPPSYIFSILQSFSANFQAAILSPQSLHALVVEKFPDPEEPPCNIKVAKIVVDYLASLNSNSAPTLAYLSGVRWFSLTDGSRVSLGTVSNKYIIPATQGECDIFKTHSRMLSWDCMSPELRACASLPNNIGILNLSTIKPTDVISVLRSRLGRLQPQQSAIDPADLTWVVQFWKWISKWARSKEFLKESAKFAGLYLLPTNQMTLRKLSNKGVVFRKTEEAAVDAWGLLGVYPLHEDLSDFATSKMKAFVESPHTSGYIPFLIRTCDISRQDHLSQDALRAIQGSLYTGLPSTLEITLTDNERSRLRRLRVFRLHSQSGNLQELGAIDGKHTLVNIQNDFPLPRQDPLAVYVDVKDSPTLALLGLVGPLPLPISDEFKLLDVAFDNWALQPIELQDRFIDWIFNLRDIPASICSRLSTLPFVAVDGLSKRLPPKGLIDPGSNLKRLYKDEVGKLPIGRFAGDYLLMLRKLGFVQSNFDADIVKERFRYLSASTDDPNRYQKAKHFVTYLNRFWTVEFSPLIAAKRAQPWLPFEANPPSLEAPDQCRDTQSSRRPHEDPYFYDLALHVLPKDIQITSLEFRQALGWAEVVDSAVLVTQFRLTVELAKSRNRNERLVTLIEYYGTLFNNGQLSSKTIRSLRAVSIDKPWIPVSSKVGSETVMTKHALLSGDTNLMQPFRQVHNFEYPTFLEEMGCTPRPKFESLIDELHQLNFKSHKEVDAGVLILREIADHHGGFDRDTILVPGENKRSLTLEEVYFCDTNLAGGTKLFPAHGAIPRALATALGIPFLSSIILDDVGEDEDDDDEQMSEDFVARIRGFLREYDVRYAMNEFLANADDAKATQFDVLLVTPQVTGGNFISTAFQELAASSLLVLHNDAMLSEADFKGLREIGTGGKVGNSDTHGRHGLGALSFYYYTDIVTVISGEHVMLLDPSGEYLPRRQYGKRTALRRKLSQFLQRYPDQLALYDSLFDFSKDSGYYNGTLFLLPLRTSKISDIPCQLVDVQELIHASYRGLAENAFFFSKLERITFDDHTILEGSPTRLWTVSAKRSTTSSLDGRFTRFFLTINRNDSKTEAWLVVMSENTLIPPCHETAATSLKLKPQSAMQVQLAIRVDHTDDKNPATKSFIFSTLRLPKVTSLPFHLNARFAISSNRQSIVFDPPDSYNILDTKTAYNMWILEELVPPLYLSTLEYLLSDNHEHQHHDFREMHWWLLEPSDDVSQLARKAFLAGLEVSHNKLFKDVGDNWLTFRECVFPGDQDPEISGFLSQIGAPSFIDFGGYLKDLARIPSANIVNPQFVKAAISECASLETMRQMIAAEDIDVKDIAKVLDYIRDETPLNHLPLLVLSPSSKLINIPGQGRTPVYRSTRASHAKLFSHTQFLSSSYMEETIAALLADDAVNVIELTDENLTDLIKHELKSLGANSRADWLDTFWDLYPDLPGPPSLDLLSALKIIRSRFANISLDECTSGKVVYAPTALSHHMDWLVPVLQHFGLDLLEGGRNAILDDHMEDQFSDLFSNVLICLESKGITSWSRLSEENRRQLSEWIRDNFSTAIYRWRRNDINIPKVFLLQLPIWEAQDVRGKALHPCSGLKVLPSGFDVRVLLPYQKAGSVVAAFSPLLSHFKEFCDAVQLKTLSPAAIMQLVQLPLRVPPGDAGLAEVKKVNDIVRMMLQYPSNEVQHANLHIPNREGTMQPIGGLYDDTIDLFAKALKYTEQSSFVHPSFQNLQGQLRPLGLSHEVDLPTFTICATAVANAFDSFPDPEGPDHHSMVEMSRAAFNVYNSTLPALIMTDNNSWSSLEDMAFIQRMATRRQGASYHADRYCVELPEIVPPRCLVRPNLESIAWTQRALFAEQPAEQLLAVNRNLGIPTVHEVVEHLKVLSTKIALDHPGDTTLLSDLKATYKWLNDHFEAAQEELLLADDVKLFLNVDSPAKDDWTGKWVPAKALVLNLRHEFGRFKRMGTFLQDYDKLLLAAGSASLKSFETNLQPEPTQGGSRDLQELRNTFRDMRQAGEFTDIILLPSTRSLDQNQDQQAIINSEDDETHVEKSDLEAHRAFLAAHIPYVRQSARGWMTTGEIPFYGSAVGAKALLDFIYTGEFDLSKPTSADKLARRLCSLLELLPIADEWDMPDLMKKIEVTIIHTHDMIQCLPFQHQTMLAEAEKYHANTLRDAVNDFRNQNSILFQD